MFGASSDKAVLQRGRYENRHAHGGVKQVCVYCEVRGRGRCSVTRGITRWRSGVMGAPLQVPRDAAIVADAQRHARVSRCGSPLRALQSSRNPAA